jgi:hypothetical protein
MDERAPPEPSTDHLIALPSVCGTWSAWRWGAFRAAGFPASLVLRLAGPDAAVAADRVLDDEDNVESARREAVDALHRVLTEPGSVAASSVVKAARAARKGRVPEEDTGTTADAAIRALRAANELAEAARAHLSRALVEESDRASLALQEIASLPAFREALVWQNRSAIHTALAPLLRRAESRGGGSRRRRHEALVANYLQRYCAKNDTIGFFGPVGWARLTTGTTAIVATPGPTLLAHRSVHFEQWPIDELAKKLAADPRLEPWTSPRRFPFVAGEGTAVRSAVNGKHELTAAQALALARCTGEQTARRLAEQLVSEQPAVFSSAAEVFEALRVLREKLLIAWTLEVPLTWNPDATLRTLLGRIDDEALRVETTSTLDELDAARTRVAHAAGDVEALETALADLDATFVRLTDVPATRNAGSMYAARGLVFEDCRRDLDVTIGEDVLSTIGPALSLVLTSARWMTFEAARVYRDRFRAIYAEVSRRSRTGIVTFEDVWFRAQRVLFGEKENPLAVVTSEVARRWSELLTFAPGTRQVRFESASLAPRVRDLFAAPSPGWRHARHHSPDLMIAAPSIEAIRSGDYEVVLGEIHVAANTLDSAALLAQHPHPEELVLANARDLPEAGVMPVYSKEWLRITTRTNRAFTQPWHYFAETGFDIAPAPRDRVLALSTLSVEDVDGDLFVRGPNGFRLELLELLGENMSLLTSSSLPLITPALHTPRVTIDRLVVSRETWRLMPSELTFAYEPTPEGRFVGARCWARALGLPRFVFVKSTIEVKPLYVDLASPVFVDMLAKVVRRTKEHVGGETRLNVSEMLPALHQTWVPDAAGAHYASELRIVALDGS